MSGKIITFLLICAFQSQFISAQNTFDKEYPFINISYDSPHLFQNEEGYLLIAPARIDANAHLLALIKTNFYGDTIWVRYLDIGITPHATFYIDGVSDPQDNLYLRYFQADYDLIKIDSEGNFIWGKDYPDLKLGPVYGDGFLWAIMQEDIASPCYLYKINPNNGGAAWRTEIFTDMDWRATSLTISESGDIAVSVAEQYYFYYPEFCMRIFTKPSDSSTFSQSILDLENNLTFLDDMKYSGDNLCGIAHYPTGSGAPFDYSCYVRFTPTGGKLLEEVISFSAVASSVNHYTLNDELDAVFICSAFYNNDSISYYFLNMNINGEILWDVNLPDNRSFTGIYYCDDGGYVLGAKSLAREYTHPCIYKTNSEGIVGVRNIPSMNSSVKIYPNPGNEFINFEASGISDEVIAIHNLIGKSVGFLNIQNGKGQLNTLSLPPGIYIYNSEKGQTGKFIVTH